MATNHAYDVAAAGGVITRLGVLFCLAVAAAAQCLVDNPGGSKVNINRPTDADVPAATFSPIARLDASLPEWMCFTAGFRTRLAHRDTANSLSGIADTYLLTRFRLGVLIKPAGQFRAYVELQDATAFWKTPPVGPPYQSTWDLRRAYIDIGDPETSTVSLRVGRQDLSFGHPRLIGTSYWRNASSGYDAAMVAINSPRLKVNAWAASPVVVYDNGLSHHVQGNNFHGIYTTVNNPVPQSTIEPYVLWRLSPGFKTQAGQPAKLDEKTVGVRWAGQAARFDYDAEISAQTGSVGSDRIRAWAWSTIAGYTMESAPLKPRVFVKYDFASGDRNPGDGVRGTFDQLYPNIHDHHGLADIVAWQNLAAARAGIRASLKSNWIVALTYNDWWLANPRDAFYSASGAPVARDRTGRSGRHIGREYDAQTSFRLNRNLELGSGIAYIRSGEFLLRANRARSFMYRYVMVYYNVL